MRPFVAFIFSIVTASLIAACVQGSSVTQGITVCDPGEQIFCRCLGGEAGTKTCQGDGASFSNCATANGPCPQVSYTSGGVVFPSSAATGGGSLALYYPCMHDGDCASGSCPMGYCSQPCAVAKDCKIGTGVCVQYAGATGCLAGCRLDSECKTLYGGSSECGYTQTIDGTPVAACAAWKSNLKLPPLGASCKDNIDCSLGHSGSQEVCNLLKCVKGCYTADDCPINTNCSGKSGVLGACK